MFASRGSLRNHLDDEMLSAYIDRALPASEMQNAQRHLAQCAECRQRLETLQGVVRLLHTLPAVEVPRSFVLRPADVEPARPSAVFTFLRAATAAVAIMLAVVVAGDLLLRQGMFSIPAAPMPAMEQAGMPTPVALIGEAPVTTPQPVPATQPAEEPAVKAVMPSVPAPTEAPPATPEAGAVLELLAAPTPLGVPLPTETPTGAPERMAAAGIEVSATPTAVPEGTPTPGVESALTAPAVVLPQVAAAAASETPYPEEPAVATALAKTSPLPTPAEGTPAISPSEVIVEPPVISLDEVPAPPNAPSDMGGGGGEIGGGAPASEPMRAAELTQTATVEVSPSLTAEAVEEETPTPTLTPTPVAATPAPSPTATPTPLPSPTPLPPAAMVSQATPEAQEPATAVAQRALPAAPATSAAPEQAPAPVPQTSGTAGFFTEDTLFLIRLVEIALALIVVSLAGATWVVRPRA